MARKISPGNAAYKLRRGQPDLLNMPGFSVKEQKETLQSTHRADFKEPPKQTPPMQGKRQELLRQFLFEKISKKISEQVFGPRSAPSYVTTTRDHFDVPGFDPEARMKPTFQYSVHTDPVITYWSENKRSSHGVTVPDNPIGNFHSSCKFSKSPAERYDGGEDW